MPEATERINIKVQSAKVRDGETYYHVICEYFPKHAERAARMSHFVRAGEGFDLEIPPPRVAGLAQADQEFLDELRRGERWGRLEAAPPRRQTPAKGGPMSTIAKFFFAYQKARADARAIKRGPKAMKKRLIHRAAHKIIHKLLY